MPNVFKHSTTNNSNCLRKGNIYLGVGDDPKGPTSSSGYYNGITPPTSGWTIYAGSVGNLPAIFCANNDTQLINFAKGFSSQVFTTTTESLNWFATQSNFVCVNRDYESITTNGLVLCIDAGFTASYSSSGVTWYDVSTGNTVATLVNGPTFNSSNGGSIVFDGINNYVITANLLNPTTNPNESVFVWFYPTAAGQIVTELGQSTINTGWHDSNIEVSSAGIFSFSIWHGNLTNRVVSTAKSFNTWYHIGFTYSGTTLTAYINGSSIGTTTFTRQTTSSLYYGLCSIDTATNMGTSAYGTGRMGNFIFYNRALSAAEVLQNYNAQSSRYVTPTLAGSLVFNGNNQSLSLSPGLTFGSGAFTVEGWFYNNSSFTNKGILGSPVTNPVGCLNLHFTTSTVITSDKNGGGGQYSYTMGSAVSLNAWHYLIYNRNADGTTAVYIDGVRCTSTSIDTLNYTTATDMVGRDYAGYWPGYWTNMRISLNGAVYNSESLTQTNPTSALTPLSNTKYLMLGAVVTTDSSGVQTVTNNNTVTQSSSLKPF